MQETYTTGTDFVPTTITPIILNGQTRNERVKEISEYLEKGVREVFTSGRLQAYFTAMSKFHQYSFLNSILIWLQGGNLVAGYTTWKNKFHRNVKKGEKSIKIFAPAPYQVKRQVTKKDGNGNVLLGKDGKPLTEEQETVITAFKVVSVFDYSQTEGEPLPELTKTLTASVEHYPEFLAALREISPVPISFQNISGDSYGYYDPTTKQIVVQKGLPELQTLKTTIHEIAHAKLHDLEKAIQTQTVLPDKYTCEVQAEGVAFAVSQHYQLDTSAYSFPYIASWSSGKELSELKASLEIIHKTTSEIIAELDKHLSETCEQE